MKYVNNDNYVIFTSGNRLDGRCTLKYVCYGNNMFVTVGCEGICAWSRNGNMYTKGTISNNVWKSVCYGNNLYGPLYSIASIYSLADESDIYANWLDTEMDLAALIRTIVP